MLIPRNILKSGRKSLSVAATVTFCPESTSMGIEQCARETKVVASTGPMTASCESAVS